MLDLVLIQLPNLALESPKMYMPLGNLYLMAMVKRAGYKAQLLDFRGGIGYIPKAKFYGFSCTTPEITVAKQIAKGLKGKKIVGGAHASLLPLDCVRDFDYVVKGEGEKVLLDILAGRMSEGIIETPRIENLDAIPLPDWDSCLEPFSRTLYTGERYGEGDTSMAVIGSRGCPYSCSFCGNVYLAPVTFRSVGNILQELLELQKRGVYHFRFVDDNFTLHPQLIKLCQEFSRYNIIYRCHTRSNLVTTEKAKALAQSGCEECSLGIESADDYVLTLNKKRETVADHIRAVKILQDAGLRAKLYWMSGLPGETDETIEANMDFMKALKPEKWTLSTFCPYPGSDIYNHPKKYGVTIVNKDWSNWWNFVFNVRDLNLPGRMGYVHILDGQTPEQMKARHDKFYYFMLNESNWR